MQQEESMGLVLPVDGRQSETALMVQRGVCRLLRDAGFATLTEFTLATGRRADVIAINESGLIWIVEIKSSPADFHADQKWPEYHEFCDRLFFAIPTTMEEALMPSSTGLIVADQWGADILRHGEVGQLHASRRKALTLAVARAAALRLHSLYDPVANS
jgi:hypothetical protein